jgi:hypothetical protein
VSAIRDRRVNRAIARFARQVLFLMDLIFIDLISPTGEFETVGLLLDPLPLLPAGVRVENTHSFSFLSIATRSRAATVCVAPRGRSFQRIVTVT